MSIPFVDIVIQILGIGKCEWTEHRRLFHAEEVYLKSEIKISEPTEGIPNLDFSYKIYYSTFQF